MKDSAQIRRTPRLLVAIASYGEKNIEFLRRIIRRYLSMAMQVDVVVLSEKPKDLGAGVEVVVGLPSGNPWSLPFAHKPIFAQKVDQYDLFAYSEDDMEVTEANIGAFVRITPELEANEIAGFLRYEMHPSGARWMPDVLGGCHWKCDSVAQRGQHLVAEFTNEHAAFYLLTQSQLRRAIASGGFLRAPYEGRYDMLCTAATDPYTCCGFRKVICVSALEEFLIHHMSNRYVGQMGLPLDQFKEQIQTLWEIRNGAHPASQLVEVTPKVLQPKWSKWYYEKLGDEVLRAVPEDARTVLSVGCGWGDTEVSLKERGACVTALPLDSVIGAAAARRGIGVVYGTWPECLSRLDGRQFDCVLLSDLLHLQEDPCKLLAQCGQFVGAGGMLVVKSPNFDRIPTLINRALGRGAYAKLRKFGESGIAVCGPGMLRRALRGAGFKVASLRWLDHVVHRGGWIGSRLRFGRLTARDWILQAQRIECSN